MEMGIYIFIHVWGSGKFVRYVTTNRSLMQPLHHMSGSRIYDLLPLKLHLRLPRV